MAYNTGAQGQPQEGGQGGRPGGALQCWEWPARPGSAGSVALPRLKNAVYILDFPAIAHGVCVELLRLGFPACVSELERDGPEDVLSMTTPQLVQAHQHELQNTSEMVRASGGEGSMQELSAALKEVTGGEGGRNVVLPGEGTMAAAKRLLGVWIKERQVVVTGQTS